MVPGIGPIESADGFEIRSSELGIVISEKGPSLLLAIVSYVLSGLLYGNSKAGCVPIIRRGDQKKKRVIEYSVVRDRVIFDRISVPKMVCLGGTINSLAFNVMRQRVSNALFVLKNIRAPFGTRGMVLKEAASTRGGFKLCKYN